jgi:hypothetical protein
MLKSLSPILIASPVHRSGTTLLQRLMCSSPDTLIYGESLANDINMLLSIFLNKQMLIGRQGDWHHQQFQQVLQGDVNDWIPNIMPDKDWVMNHFEQSIFQYLKGFEQEALRHGRVYWGTKLPAWPTAMLNGVFRLMPQSRLLYIIRDLESCVRSAKLIGFCQDIAAIQQFAQLWKQNQERIIYDVPKEQLLLIPYDELCDQPEKTILKIERFTGVKKIDASVLQHRINNYNRIQETPPELTTDEQVFIDNFQPLPAFSSRGDSLN